MAHEQLDALLEASTHPAMNVRVLPFDRDGFTGSGFSMLYLDGRVPSLDTAQFDTVHGSIFEDEESRLGGYRRVLDRVTEMAIPTGNSRDLINRIAKEL